MRLEPLNVCLSDRANYQENGPLCYLDFEVRGGPFDTWGGAMVFLCDQTFFDSQLKRTIFLDLIKSKQFFFSGVQHKIIFFTVYFI